MSVWLRGSYSWGYLSGVFLVLLLKYDLKVAWAITRLGVTLGAIVSRCYPRVMAESPWRERWCLSATGRKGQCPDEPRVSVWV